MKYLFIAILFLIHHWAFAMMFLFEFLWDFKIIKYEKFDYKRIRREFKVALKSPKHYSLQQKKNVELKLRNETRT